ncbi:MAG: NAD(P)-binding domain-containing protein [Dehalococcoidia bacterium]
MSDASGLRVFGEADGDLSVLDGRAIAVIGYGNQGRTQALNLRDSGVEGIVVATLRDESWTNAEADGFAPRSVADATAASDILFLLVPDEELPDVFAEHIEAHLKPADTLVFATGYNLAFGEMTPPKNVDLVMLAPRMIGQKARELFERGEGFYSYVSVEQDASGRAWPVLLALAKGIGTLRAGAFEVSARDEAVLDLFAEQGWGAVVGSTIMLMLDVATKAGLPPEALILDTYFSGEMTETFEAMAELGFYDQSRLHSRTSQYGGMMRTIAMDREPIRKHLETVLAEIQSGAFAKQWAEERANGCENFERLRDLGRQANPFTPIEERIRAAVREARKRA